jgi:hypothetical protein
MVLFSAVNEKLCEKKQPDSVFVENARDKHDLEKLWLLRNFADSLLKVGTVFSGILSRSTDGVEPFLVPIFPLLKRFSLRKDAKPQQRQTRLTIHETPCAGSAPLPMRL